MATGWDGGELLIESYNNGRNCIITCPLGGNFALLTGIPGHKKWIERQLVFTPTGAAIAYILEHWPNATWGEGADALLQRYMDVKMEEENNRSAKREELTDDSGYEFKTVPYKHQRQSFLLARNKEAWAHFHEQGTGKTKIVIDTAAYLFEKNYIKRAVVIAKNGVHHNWVINEIPAHLPDRIPSTRTWYSVNRKGKVIIQPEKRAGKLHWITFNIEGFTSKYAEELLIGWLEADDCLVVIDESSRIKNPSAMRTKFLIKAGKLAGFRRIMTGTPLTSGIENIFSQFKFLDENILGHRSFYTFRSEFCIMGGFEHKAIVGYKKTEELTQMVDGWSDRVLKKDCLDLPPKVYKRIPFELSPQHRRVYDAYRKDAIEEIKALLGQGISEKAAEEIVITKLLRLQQISCGLVPGTKTGERLEGTDMRMKILTDQMEDAQGKLIVWARFIGDLNYIMKQWGQKAVGYFGGITEKERISSVQRFRDSDKVQYFVASSAAAYGHSLPAIGAVYHSQSSSLDIRLQSEDRCHGINRTVGPTTTYWDLEGLRTVDQKIIRAMKKNKDLADQITKDPISMFMEDDEDGE